MDGLIVILSGIMSQSGIFGCHYCDKGKVVMRRCRTGYLSCKECFINNFEEEIHEYTTDNR